jgi:hypothetical protein
MTAGTLTTPPSRRSRRRRYRSAPSPVPTLRIAGGPGNLPDRQPVARSDSGVPDGDRPAHHALAALGDPPAHPSGVEAASSGSAIPISSRVAAAERDDPVVGADPLVASAAGGDEPVLGLESRGGGVGVRGRDEDVVGPHGRGVVYPTSYDRRSDADRHFPSPRPPRPSARDAGRGAAG